MNDRFVYDERTSTLYAPNGQPLKQVHCPKAMHWNQLRVEDGEERWRGCTQCKERVVNLDVMEVAEAVSLLGKRGKRVCVHGSTESGRVIFLQDPDAIWPSSEVKVDEQGRRVIQTARTIEAINRAVNMGYWPDVRLVNYEADRLRSKVSVGQHLPTGRIRAVSDYRFGFRRPDDPRHHTLKAELAKIEASPEPDELEAAMIRDELAEIDWDWVAVVPFTDYYPYYQSLPVAAYLIPKDLPDGTDLLIEDPIEEIVGASWNQGGAYRERDVPGKLEGRRVTLGKKEVSAVRRFVG